MKQKTKIITGVVALCLVCAVAASLVTAAVHMRGWFGFQSLIDRVREQETDLTESTRLSSPQTDPATVLSPSPSPTPHPTPPVVTPTPSQMPSTETSLGSEGTDPSESSETLPPAQMVEEQLGIWQNPDWVADLYEAVSPAVVGISVEIEETVTSIRRTHQGSGLIMSQDGVIVTNSNILTMALNRRGQILDHARINVYIKNLPRPYRANLIGRDPLTGLAVLRINAGSQELMAAPIAEQPQLRVGQMVLAIGYPDMLRQSGNLYTGLISSINQPVQLEDGTTVQMIQTDARIDQSCSGGPLLNLSGEVIGLTNCGLARQSYDMQSYALPALTAQNVVEDLMSQGYVGGRSWLGVSVLVEDTFLQLQSLYDFPSGLYVTHVIDDSPAYIADLRRGDIITQINDQAVAPDMDISAFLQSHPVGSLLQLVVYRQTDDQYHEFRVYLQEYER